MPGVPTPVPNCRLLLVYRWLSTCWSLWGILCFEGSTEMGTPIRDQNLDNSPYELLSKLLVSPLIGPIILPYIIPCITPFKEFRLQLLCWWCTLVMYFRSPGRVLDSLYHHGLGYQNRVWGLGYQNRPQ